MRKHLTGWSLAAAAVLAPLQARAGIPVIDTVAIAQLVQQVTYWQQQISGMAQQLGQLQQTHAALTGSRGMEALAPASDLARNYLPPDYSELMRTVQGTSTTYSGLSGQVQSIMNANAVLSTTQLGSMSPEMRQLVEQGRQSAAMLSTMTRGAYQNTSQRFAALQTLINGIGRAQDPKSIQDLQARIQAEQGMLTNEHTKLQSLYQVAQADEIARGQRIAEQVVSGHGGFTVRFAPTPQR